jgi:hypothetical protein
LLSEDGSASASDLSTSNELVLAVRKLASVGVSKTRIVEDVLGMTGRNFNDGMKLLEKMLEEPDTTEG